MSIRKAMIDSAPFAIRLVWVILLCVPVSWLLMSSAAKSGVLTTPASVAAAAWMQAIGSILAIAGAAFFPYFHEAKKDRNRSERLRQILLLLAKNQQEQLRLLHSTLFNAVHDFGEDTINPYLGNQWQMKWPPHIEALRSIQITDLDPGQVYMLTEMKVGADFAWSICLRLSDWNVIGDKEQVDIQQVKHYLTMTSIAVALLDRGGREGVS
ncbi:hypothetical protein [Pseudomonas allokribbensis]|uniref:hypothetical protein n=1 Tax=Pseudomonas allokribbensis TaxID=2774460 RepID=UPI00178780BB|nr:hypothetical protein [Pseudomonas allokribbensis]